MNDNDILKEAFDASGMKQVDIAKILNVSRPTVSTHFNRKNIGLRVFVRLLTVMGYKVCVGKDENGQFVPMWEVKENE